MTVLVICVALRISIKESICILQSCWTGFVPGIIRSTGCTYNTLVCVRAWRTPSLCAQMSKIYYHKPTLLCRARQRQSGVQGACVKRSSERSVRAKGQRYLQTFSLSSLFTPLIRCRFPCSYLDSFRALISASTKFKCQPMTITLKCTLLAPAVTISCALPFFEHAFISLSIEKLFVEQR